MPSKHSEQTLAKFAALFSGLVFGIYWIPLRALDSAGFPGLWATTIFNLTSTVLVLPIIIYYWHSFFPGRLRFHLICFGCGLGYALYATAFVYTEVVSVLALFYLMPIWGFFVARWVTKDAITPVRWASMIIGFGGLWVILGKGSEIPIPQNIGDWMALVAGVIWAGIALTILTDKKEKPVNYAVGFITWACLITLACSLIATNQGLIEAPQWGQLKAELVWLIPFALIVIVPAAIATVYAPSKLNPGIVGLLFMTEISVGVITAAIWANEPFGTRQVIGIVLITIAGVLETAWLYYKKPA